MSDKGPAMPSTPGPKPLKEDRQAPREIKDFVVTNSEPPPKNPPDHGKQKR